MSLLITGCSLGFKSGEDFYSSSAKTTAECMESSFDSCIYKKSPVADAGQSLSDSILPAYQTNMIRFEGLLSTTLESSKIKITTTKTDSISSQNAKNYYNDSSSEVEQSQAYQVAYKLNQSFKDIFSTYWMAMDTQIAINIDSNWNGYDPADNTIHLKKDSASRSAALDSSLIVFNLLLANSYQQTSGAILSGLATQGKDCKNSKGIAIKLGCCKNKSGCGLALYYAQAEYLASVYFEKQKLSVSLGETYGNNPKGKKICGLVKNLNESKNLSFNQSYTSCQTSAQGLASVMSLSYSALWWKVRSQLTTQDLKELLDELFIKHIADLTGGMNFREAIDKAKLIDSAQYEGQFSSLLESEFNNKNQ